MTFSTPPAHAPSSQPRLVGKVPVSATALAANDTSLWAISASFTAGKPGTLTRIDPRTRRVLARINVGDSPQAVAADAGGVWVTNPFQGTTSGGSANYPHNNSIMRIDPATNRVVATISSEHPEDVALGFGAVWVTSRDGTALETTLLRIDPATNRVVTKIPLAKASDDSRVTVGESYAWVSVPVSAPNGTISQIYRIDPTSNQATKVASIEGVGGGQIASGEGAVWVTAPMQTSASGLVRLDPTTGSVIARITLPDAAPVGLTAVTTGNGFVWATSARGSFWKVDPASDHPIGDPQLIGAVPPEGAPDVLSAFGSVWVASDDGRIWQFTP